MGVFTAELVGTTLLILLGDGVVAAVVLSKSKAEKSGWIVITTGWALAVFSTAPAIRHAPSNFATEVVGTGVLVFGVLALGANKPPNDAGLTPLLVGLLVWAIGLSLGGPTGYAINPARDLAPRIAHAILPIPGKGGSDWGYSWIPVLGPLIGGLIAAFVYKTWWPA